MSNPKPNIKPNIKPNVLDPRQANYDAFADTVTEGPDRWVTICTEAIQRLEELRLKAQAGTDVSFILSATAKDEDVWWQRALISPIELAAVTKHCMGMLPEPLQYTVAMQTLRDLEQATSANNAPENVSVN